MTTIGPVDILLGDARATLAGVDLCLARAAEVETPLFQGANDETTT